MPRSTSTADPRTRRPSPSAATKVIPNLGPAGGTSTNTPYVAKAERAIRPESIALGVFGLVAALAALVINAQVISRLVRRNAEEGAIVRALGAGPTMAMADGLLGVLGAVLAGSLLAVAVAVALSPLAPIGPVRPVYPDIGVAFDWTVLGFGLLVFVVLLTAAALLIAYRVAPHRLARRAAFPDREAVWSRAAASAGLSPSAVLGIRSALGARSGRDAAPVRSALLGAVRRRQCDRHLAHVRIEPQRPGVAAVALRMELELRTAGRLLGRGEPAGGRDGRTARPRSRRGPLGRRVLRERHPGRAVRARAGHEARRGGDPLHALGARVGAPSQVVLGPATLASLHAHVGDTVVADRWTPTRHVRLRIVGTATLPTIGGSGSPSLAMGTGAVMATSLFSATDLNQQGSPVSGPMAVFIAVRPGVSHAAALRSLDHITAVLNRPSDPDAPIGGVVSALRPAEIANYRSVGATPALLAAVLAAGAIAALGLTLVASVRQRRRQFALLKALGFTQRQLAASVAWQSSVAAVVGVVLGVPIGIALGRYLWTLFADGISAVPHPTVPGLSIIAVAIGALVFANLVALVPGRVAARTRTSLLLRAE